jgi:hypothetical protein
MIKNKFKVGDYIIGTKSATGYYPLTSEECICKITKLIRNGNKEYSSVEVIWHPTDKRPRSNDWKNVLVDNSFRGFKKIS